MNFKLPGGGAFPPHQDFPAYEKFGPREHVTAMISLDPATLENGCLHVARHWKETFKNSDRVDQKLLEEGKAILPFVEEGENHGSIKEEMVDKIEWQALKTKPADPVLFDSYVPHYYSEPNHSQNSRRAMFITTNRKAEGEHREKYYEVKLSDPNNPLFHFATPTK